MLQCWRCLLWVKRGQTFIKRFKNLMQCQAGGITQLGKKENLVGAERVCLEMISGMNQSIAVPG